MYQSPSKIEQFISEQKLCILVSVSKVKGSTPRNIDAFMLISEQKSIGTIGGGRLEFLAIEKAQKMLVDNWSEQELEISLGRESAQCCGGFVKLKLQKLDDNLVADLLKSEKQKQENLPHIYLFGAGHVGKALASLLVQMPYNTSLIETRQNMMVDIMKPIKTILNPLPEMIVREAKANSAFVIFTHDHELDFLILSEILKREDAKYVGMIGSKTKRKKFENWFLKNDGASTQLAKLTCPIGDAEIGDKRPEIIAALTLGEIISRLNSGE